MGPDTTSSGSHEGDSLDMQRFIRDLVHDEDIGIVEATHVASADTSSVRPKMPEVSALDVAEYILRKLGRMSTMKLQKLVYYCQAWALVWDEKPLFQEDVEAWANGPVIRELFNYHRGFFDIEHVYTGNPALLSEDDRETVDTVLNFLGNKSAQWLIQLSHSEPPWQEAREGLPETARGSRIISRDLMADYYSSLLGN